MYPEPHIPSARTDRPLSGDHQLSERSKRALFVLTGSVLLFVISLSISMSRQEDLRCVKDESGDIEAQLVAAEYAEPRTEPRLSSRTHPTRSP